MKQFKVLLMLLIGMIGFTALASTPVTEQKQKIEIVKDFQVLAMADNVLSFELVSVNTDAIYLQSNGAQILQIVSEPLSILAIITDVGWQRPKQIFNDLACTERALKHYNLHYKRVTNKANIRIRSDC